jgi:hypothetical protein
MWLLLLTMFEALPASRIFASIIMPSAAPVSDVPRPMCIDASSAARRVAGQHMVPSALVDDIISFLVGSGACRLCMSDATVIKKLDEVV